METDDLTMSQIGLKKDKDPLVVCTHHGCKTKIKKDEVINFGNQLLCKPCFDDFNNWHYEEYGYKYKQPLTKG